MAFTEYEFADGLLVVAFGRDGRALDVNDPRAVQDSLREYLPDVRVVASADHDWLGDPYSQGVWCAWRPRQLTRYAAELRRSEGCLVFAGGETANGWSVAIDGAIKSGLRAGREAAKPLAG